MAKTRHRKLDAPRKLPPAPKPFRKERQQLKQLKVLQQQLRKGLTALPKLQEIVERISAKALTTPGAVQSLQNPVDASRALVTEASEVLHLLIPEHHPELVILTNQFAEALSGRELLQWYSMETSALISMVLKGRLQRLYPDGAKFLLSPVTEDLPDMSFLDRPYEGELLKI